MYVKFKNMQNLTVYYFQISMPIYRYNMKSIKHAKNDECQIQSSVFLGQRGGEERGRNPQGILTAPVPFPLKVKGNSYGKKKKR